jgi:hypothetical protein
VVEPVLLSEKKVEVAVLVDDAIRNMRFEFITSPALA